MVQRPLHFQNLIHLLSADDVATGAEAAATSGSAQITTPDGRQLVLSAAGWAAMNHVLECLTHDQSVYIASLEKRVSLREASAMTGLPVDYLEKLSAQGRLPVRADSLGGTVLLSDLVAFAREERQRRDVAFEQYLAGADEMPDAQL